MTRIWTCTWLLRVNTGPPTWWRPNVGADLNEGVLIVKAGWLRACVQIAVGIRRARDEETAETDREPFPFTRPDGSEADMFIQWKGTKVCLDFDCACGASGHIDAPFAYHVRCPACGAVYQMGTQVIARRVAEPAGAVVTFDAEEEPA